MDCCKKIPARYIIMAMIFFSTYINYCTRSNMSMSLPAMAHEKDLVPECKRDEIPPEPVTVNSNKTETSNVTVTSIIIDEEDTGEKFEWDQSVQAQILTAYFYGYLIGSLPGGAIAELFGPCWTILGATAFSGILNSCCVFVAGIHWGALIALRVLIGFAGGFVYPALQCLIGRWAPPQERAKFVACLMGNCLGTAVTWIIVGTVTKSYKWPWGFHVMSLQLVVFCIIFALLTADSPEQHRWITEEELDYIKTSQEGVVSKTKSVAPYKSIFLSFPFAMLCILHFGNLYGVALQLTAIPKFMKEYIGFNIQKSGVLASLPHLVRLFFGLGYGVIADYLKKRKYRRVVILKSFVMLSHIIPGILIGLVVLVKCNSTAAVVLLTLSMAINGAAVCTNLSNPTDLSPNFAGTLFGLMSTIGGTSGLICPSVTGVFLKKLGNNGSGWGAVFALGAVIYCATGVIFIFFGSAETQKWNEKIIDQSPSQS